MRFSVLIPTYNRPADLLACLRSIAPQTERPAECVIVDDGDLSAEDLAGTREALAGIELRYYRKNHAHEPRGQAASKNIGLRLASQDVVFIFDDDVVLEPGFFSASMEVWRTLDDAFLMGVGGTITNLRRRSRLERLYNAVFLLTAPNAWDVSAVGFQVWDEAIEQRVRGYYLHGGLCSLHRTRALRFPFGTFRAGRSALEEVDFCLRAKNAGYFFYMEPRARALHKTSPASREGMYLYGVKESSNRKEIFRCNGSGSFRYRMWFAWSSVGWVLRQLLAGNFLKAVGMVVGLLRR